MKHPTATLEGANLDYAVAIADGWTPHWFAKSVSKVPYWIVRAEGRKEIHWYAPSTDWSQGGPIIEREGIELIHDSATHKSPEVWSAVKYLPPLPGEVINVEQDGPTPLIAAMRCFVASKLGEEVEIP